MHKLYELKEKLVNELEDYADNGKFSKEDVEAIKYTASAIDHICNIVERSDEEDYSGAMMGRMPYSYRDGERTGSYARRGGTRRYGSAGYSRASEGIVEELRDLMEDAPDDRIRQEIKTLIHKVEKM